MKIRGILTIAAAGSALLVGDLIQRTLIVAAVRLMPSRRHRILAFWQQALARCMLGSARLIGGARHLEIPRIPGGPGTLVLMNHQSLMDIPLVVRALDDTYPRIVTRSRYASGKPLISHMIRLYQYPTVDPGATVRSSLDELREQTASSPVPVVIFPEGTRTRDGSLSKFRRRVSGPYWAAGPGRSGSRWSTDGGDRPASTTSSRTSRRCGAAWP